MPIFWIDKKDFRFPDSRYAFPDGLLAVGGDLSTKRLIEAYSKGIFPWYNPEDPILWWTLDPRLVMFPDKIKISKSMRVYFNRSLYTCSFNQAFERVIRNCGEVLRKKQEGSWIHEDIVEAYCKLHKAGFAHSVEVWKEDELVGGLYGVAIGKIFFGESMFALLPNASKFGFISLVKKLQALDFMLIDCQQETDHLKSMGAEAIKRDDFEQFLRENADKYDLQKLNLS